MQHPGILSANVVESVVLSGNLNGLLKLADARLLVDERELHGNRAVEKVEEVTPIFKNGGLVLIPGKLVVDVIETDRFRVKAAVHLASPVAAHFHIGDRLLSGLRALAPLTLFLLSDDALFFLSGERVAVNFAVLDGKLRLCRLFAVVCQSAIPPFP